MTQKLSDTFNLPPIEDISFNFDDDENEIVPSSEEVIEELKKTIATQSTTMDMSMKVDAALPMVVGLEAMRAGASHFHGAESCPRARLQLRSRRPVMQSRRPNHNFRRYNPSLCLLLPRRPNSQRYPSGPPQFPLLFLAPVPERVNLSALLGHKLKIRC